jgi:murein DD-endopeptidase MepM/ murein hydrolase activator NlpD
MSSPQPARRLAVACAVAALGAATDVRISVAARAIHPGELVVLTMTTPRSVEAVTVRAFSHDITAYRVGPRTWRALVGIDLDVAPGAYEAAIDARAGGSVLHASQALDVGPHKFPTRTLQVDEAYVNPPAELQARIEREAAELRRIWRSSAPERLWSAPFIRPVPGEAVSRFGMRSIFNGQARNPHGGADFMSPAGTPIKAPNAGRILLARNLYFSGNTVVIDHGLGLFSLLAHLSEIGVHEEQTVNVGQVVGLVGATGRVTGPHLHWAVRVADARVDPVAVLALLGDGPRATEQRSRR